MHWLPDYYFEFRQTHEKFRRQCISFLLVAFTQFGFPTYYVAFGVLWPGGNKLSCAGQVITSLAQ